MYLPREVLSPRFDMADVLERTARDGYAFTDDAITPEVCSLLIQEIAHLPMKGGERVNRTARRGAPNEVRQQLERAYIVNGSAEAPVGSQVNTAIAHAIHGQSDQYPELADWLATELGYQRYRRGADHISAHRDRKSDKLLAVTLTLAGSALIKVFKPLGDPDDYTNLEQIDEYRTAAGSLMTLRAPGFAGGEQAIHQVLPPEQGIRTVLNLRMRGSILNDPAYPNEQ